jgi:hypothetical protein
MPNPYKVGQTLAQQNKPLPAMNNTSYAVQQQVKSGYASGKK